MKLSSLARQARRIASVAKRRISFEHDVRRHGLSEGVVGDTDDRRETNARDFVYYVLDLDGADLLAALLIMSSLRSTK